MHVNIHIRPLVALLALALLTSGCQKASDSPEDSANKPQAQPSEEIHQSDADKAHSDHEEDGEHDHDHSDHQAHEDHDHEHEHEQAGHDHAGHDHSNMQMRSYECEPKQTIEAHYPQPNTATADDLNAHLLIDGIEYELTPMTLSVGTASSIVYQSDIGIDDNAGIIWQVDGDKGVLINKTLTGKVPVDQEKVLFTCYELND